MIWALEKSWGREFWKQRHVRLQSVPTVKLWWYFPLWTRRVFEGEFWGRPSTFVSEFDYIKYL